MRSGYGQGGGEVGRRGEEGSVGGFCGSICV